LLIIIGLIRYIGNNIRGMNTEDVSEVNEEEKLLVKKSIKKVKKKKSGRK